MGIREGGETPAGFTPTAPSSSQTARRGRIIGELAPFLRDEDNDCAVDEEEEEEAEDTIELESVLEELEDAIRIRLLRCSSTSASRISKPESIELTTASLEDEEEEEAS